MKSIASLLGRFLATCTRGVRAVLPGLCGLVSETRTGTEWALPDSNQRPPPCKGGSACTAESGTGHESPANRATPEVAPHPSVDLCGRSGVRVVYAGPGNLAVILRVPARRLERRRCTICGALDHYPADSPLLAPCRGCEDFVRLEVVG